MFSTLQQPQRQQVQRAAACRSSNHFLGTIPPTPLNTVRSRAICIPTVGIFIFTLNFRAFDCVSALSLVPSDPTIVWHLPMPANSRGRGTVSKAIHPYPLSIDKRPFSFNRALNVESRHKQSTFSNFIQPRGERIVRVQTCHEANACSQ